MVSKNFLLQEKLSHCFQPILQVPKLNKALYELYWATRRTTVTLVQVNSSFNGSVITNIKNAPNNSH